MQKDLLDYTGHQFGDWLVLAEAPKNRFGHRAWFCRCICGIERSVLIAHLKSGRSQGCGCSAVERKTKHGMRKSPHYGRWREMHQRCRNPKNLRFQAYGGRGITICDEWYDLDTFIRDMGPTWRPGLTLDRIDNDLGYSPENCRWIPLPDQSKNRRPASEWKF